MKRLIVYDLDGTLVDTLGDITEAANHMLRQLARAEVPAAEIRRAIGGGVQELVKRCLNTEDARAIEDGVGVFRAYYRSHLVERSRLYPGARAMLDHFKGRRQAVLTNKPASLSLEILRALSVGEYFCEVIGGESSFPKKPHPAALRALMEHAGVTPDDTLLIGDSPIDVSTGRNAGVLTIVVTHGFSDEAELREASPDALVSHFNGLLEYAMRQSL